MQIVLNLFPFQEALLLPAMYLVQTDQYGGLTYIAQKATPLTCASYDIEQTPALQKIFDWTELLSPKSLEQRFKPAKAKAATPLAQLLAPQSNTKTPVENFIHRHLDLLLSEVIRQGYAIALDAERKSVVKDVQVLVAQDELVPHLSFKKTDTGIEYRFQLGTETAKWPISTRNVLVLTNTNPAWIIADHVLFKVPGINGNMVKPFRQKDLVQIPADKVKMYFKQFIARSAGRGHIEAEGFEVETANTLLNTRLEFVEDILLNRWCLKPQFDYKGASFMAGEKRDQLSTVEHDDETDAVKVHRILRDHTAEAARIETLCQLGLEQEGRVFLHNPIPDIYETIAWVVQHKSQLIRGGFEILPPQVEDQAVALQTGTISVQYQTMPDWFDVNGWLEVGKYRFPFRALVPYLRKKKPYFPLPDDTVFLIPQEWFSKYSELALALREEADELRLPKALFTIVQGMENTEDNGGISLPIIDPDAIEYSTSPDLKATLRPYQLFGVKWLIGHYQHGFGACLADDMGLGKTLQTIALLLYAKAQQTPSKVEHLDETPASSLRVEAPTLSEPGLQLDLFNPQHQALPAAEPGTYQPQTSVRKTWYAPAATLVILPASLVFNWQKELERFAPSLFVRPHTGPKREKDPRVLGSHDVVLTTYHTARQDLQLLSAIPWHIIILDESQQIKNRDSEISKVVRSLKAQHKISLSGTPIENSLADLWTQMEFINPATLGTYKHFREQFQVPIEKNGNERASQQLFTRVQPFFLRRTKEQVAPDLPALSEQVFYSEMSVPQRKRYEIVRSAVRNEILQLFDDPKTRLQAIQALMRLRQLANHPVLAEPDYTGDSGKTEDVLAQLDTLRKSGHKVLFFSSFVQHLEVFRRHFEQENIAYTWLSGESTQAERAAAVAQFQENADIPVFLCSIKAGGVGLNITAAEYVFLLDPWWNPAAEDQAIARAHRIGQTKPVTVVRFISRDTVEEKIRELQARKKVLGAVLWGTDKETPDLSKEDIELLLA